MVQADQTSESTEALSPAERQAELKELESGCFWAGSLVVLVGGVLIFQHVQTRSAALDPNQSPEELRFQRRRYSRRLQTSALLVALGALIALFGKMAPLESSPLFGTLYIAGLLLLAFWLVVLALSDGYDSRRHLTKPVRREEELSAALKNAMADVRAAHGIEDVAGDTK